MGDRREEGLQALRPQAVAPVQRDERRGCDDDEDEIGARLPEEHAFQTIGVAGDLDRGQTELTFKLLYPTCETQGETAPPQAQPQHEEKPEALEEDDEGGPAGGHTVM